MFICIDVCMYIDIYIYRYVCMCVCVCLHVCMNVNIPKIVYTSIFTYIQALGPGSHPTLFESVFVLHCWAPMPPIIAKKAAPDFSQSISFSSWTTTIGSVRIGAHVSDSSAYRLKEAIHVQVVT